MKCTLPKYVWKISTILFNFAVSRVREYDARPCTIAVDSNAVYFVALEEWGNVTVIYITCAVGYILQREVFSLKRDRE
jgi:hypothetical protein